MVGAAGIGYWVAHAAFWILVAWALVELGVRRAGVFVGLWLIGYAGTAWMPPAAPFFMSYVALLDVALVLMLFRGDVRLT
jgi:hypothetical protein